MPQAAMPGMVGLASLSAVAALVIRDPHVPNSWGSCPVLAITGWYCPGCGGLRAINDLAHGDVLAALSSNVYAVGIFALGLGIWFGWFRAGLQGRRYVLTWLPEQALILLGTVGFAAFTIVRNLQAFAVLAP